MHSKNWNFLKFQDLYLLYLYLAKPKAFIGAKCLKPFSHVKNSLDLVLSLLEIIKITYSFVTEKMNELDLMIDYLSQT